MKCRELNNVWWECVYFELAKVPAEMSEIEDNSWKTQYYLIYIVPEIKIELRVQHTKNFFQSVHVCVSYFVFAWHGMNKCTLAMHQ